MSIFVILTRAGGEVSRQRTPLDQVEAFSAVSKYIIATLATGEELFVADMVDSTTKNKLERNPTGKIRNSLTGITKFLGDSGEIRFLLIKRNCLLNMAYLTQVKHLDGDNGEATVMSGRTYSISRRHRPATNRAFRVGVDVS